MWVILFIFLVWLPLSVALSRLSDSNSQPFQTWWRKALFSAITLPSIWAHFLQSFAYRGSFGIWLANLVHWFKN